MKSALVFALVPDALGVAWAVIARPSGFGALTLVSGWNFTVNQFSEFWFYIVPLAGGFGIQVALYVRLRQVISRFKESGTVLAASGTTSAAAMISCCAHYLKSVAPMLGALSGLLLAGIPLEELGFGFAFGTYWAGLYEHLMWRATSPRTTSAFASDGGHPG